MRPCLSRILAAAPGKTIHSGIVRAPSAPLPEPQARPIEPALMNIAQSPSFVLNQGRLEVSNRLSREEILGLLDLAEHFVAPSSQIERTRGPLTWVRTFHLLFGI